ncbi:hypothetical protein [Changjiang picorna-like virus 15]|uniref:hypothetical protein n=1 Tax=Changjiang picorna-like virus 15 TaxID=1922788 RepID=UPI00090ACB33|nr:hypothetical protein [Changjiang picorna-like virus 15]APG79010.1 hypothetical protein [Changjiang picorna-like virus 15]
MNTQNCVNGSKLPLSREDLCPSAARLSESKQQLVALGVRKEHKTFKHRPGLKEGEYFSPSEQLKSQRDAQFKAKKEWLQAESNDTRILANQVMSKQKKAEGNRKAHNKKYAVQRILEKNEKHRTSLITIRDETDDMSLKKNLTKELNMRHLSPYMDLTYPNMGFEERLNLFNKNHKCKHGFRYNYILKAGSLYYVKCDHEMEDNITDNITERCGNCGNYSYLVSRMCDCTSISRCRRCHYTAYRYQGLTTARHKCGRPTLAELTLREWTPKSKTVGTKSYASAAATDDPFLAQAYLNEQVKTVKSDRKSFRKELASLPLYSTPIQEVKKEEDKPLDVIFEEGEPKSGSELPYEPTVFDFLNMGKARTSRVLKKKFKHILYEKATPKMFEGLGGVTSLVVGPIRAFAEKIFTSLLTIAVNGTMATLTSIGAYVIKDKIATFCGSFYAKLERISVRASKALKFVTDDQFVSMALTLVAAYYLTGLSRIGAVLHFAQLLCQISCGVRPGNVEIDDAVTWKPREGVFTRLWNKLKRVGSKVTFKRTTESADLNMPPSDVFTLTVTRDAFARFRPSVVTYRPTPKMLTSFIFYQITGELEVEEGSMNYWETSETFKPYIRHALRLSREDTRTLADEYRANRQAILHKYDITHPDFEPAESKAGVADIVTTEGYLINAIAKETFEGDVNDEIWKVLDANAKDLRRLYVEVDNKLEAKFKQVDAMYNKDQQERGIQMDKIRSILDSIDHQAILARITQAENRFHTTTTAITTRLLDITEKLAKIETRTYNNSYEDYEYENAEGRSGMDTFVKFVTSLMKFPDPLKMVKNLFECVKNCNALLQFQKLTSSSTGAISSSIKSFFYFIFGWIDGDHYLAAQLKKKDSCYAKYTHHSFQAGLANMQGNAALSHLERENTQEHKKLIMEDVADKPWAMKAVLSHIARCDKVISEKFKQEKVRHDEPLWVHVHGSAGVGKSTIAKVLASSICSSAEDIDKRIYTRFGTNEYWDGYQPENDIILYDDLGSDRQTSRDWLELINIVSIAPYVPQMATIDNADIGTKGTYVHPKMVISCSNLSDCDSVNVIGDKEVIHRRMHIRVHVTRKRDGKAELPRADDFSHLNFYITHIQGNKVDQQCNLAQLQTIIRKTYDRKQEIYKKLEGNWKKALYKNPVDIAEFEWAIYETARPKSGFVMSVASLLLENFLDIYIMCGLNGLSNRVKFWVALIMSIVIVMTIVISVCVLVWSYCEGEPQSGEELPKARKTFYGQPRSGEFRYTDRLRLNTGRLFVGHRFVNITYISDMVCMTVDHIFRQDAKVVPEGTPCKIMWTDVNGKVNTILFTFKQSNLYSRQDLDLAFYKFDTFDFQPKRDITKYFWTAQQSIAERDARVVLWNGKLCDTSVNREHVNVKYTSDNLVYKVHDTAVIKYSSADGDCGSVCEIKDVGCVGIIHAEVSDGTSIRIVTQEMIKEAMMHFQPKVKTEIKYHPDLEFGKPLNCELGIVETIKNPLFQPTKTDIVPSPLFEQVINPHLTEPAILSIHDKRNVDKIDPKIKAQKQYLEVTDRPIYEYDQEVVDSIVEDYKQLKSIVPRRELTTEEVLNGIPMIPHLDSMDLSTSPGGMWAMNRKTKRDLVDIAPSGYRTPKKELVDKINEYHDCYMRGERTTHFYIDHLKDERRKMNKIKDVSTRLFSACDMARTIVGKRIFGTLFAHLMHNCTRHDYSPGLDRTGGNWHEFIADLLSLSPVGFDLDYKGWDINTQSRQYRMLVAVLQQALQWWYGHADYDVFVEAYVMEACYSVHVSTIDVNGKVQTISYIWDGKVTTGDFITMFGNCILNQCNIRKAWIHTSPRQYISLQFYKKNVKSRYTGDDNEHAVNPNCSWFNPVSVAKYLSYHGFKITAANKTDELTTDFKPVLELEYLKNKTKRINGWYTPVMDISAVVDQINWIRKGSPDLPIKQSQVNCQGVMRCLFAHGREKFDEIRDKILEVQPDFGLFTYNTLMQYHQVTGSLPGGGIYVDEDPMFIRGIPKSGNDPHRMSIQEVDLFFDIYIPTLSLNAAKQFYTQCNKALATKNLNSENTTNIEATRHTQLSFGGNHITRRIEVRVVKENSAQAVELVIAGLIACNQTVIIKPLYTRLQNYITNPVHISIEAANGEVTSDYAGGKPTMGTNRMNYLQAKPKMGTIGQKIDGVVNALNPLNVIGDVLGFLDKPAYTENPGIYIERDHHYLAHAVGSENIDKLLLYPQAQQLCDKEHFGQNADYCKLSWFTKSYSLLGQYTWKSTDAVGTIIASGFVGPMATIETDETQYPSVDFMSRFFQNWRGSMDYKVSVITSAFHEGKLDFTFHPGLVQPPVDIVAGMSQYAVSYSVRNEKNMFVARVPYLGETPWKKVYNGVSVTDAVADNAYRFQDYFMGSWALRVSAPLRIPSTVAEEVDINIFVAGGPDYALNTPSITNVSIQPDIPVVQNTFGSTAKFDRAVAKSGEEDMSQPLIDNDVPDQTTYGDEGETDGVVVAESDANVQSLDSSEKVPDTSVGVTLKGHSTNTVLTARNSEVARTRAELHMKDKAWDVTSMLSRFTLFDTFTWNLTDSVGTVLTTYDITRDLLNASITTLPFATFQQFRCDHVNLQFHIVASRYHQGRVCAFFIPTMADKLTFKKDTTFPSITLFQHGWLDPAAGSNITLKIPFVHYKGWLNIVNGDTLGTVVLIVFNQLKAVTGSASSVDIKAFFNIDKPTFKIPRPGKTSLGAVMRHFTEGRPYETGGPRSGEVVLTETSSISADVLAAEPGLTKDPKAKHFGETYESLTEMCKRYQPMAQVPWLTVTPRITDYAVWRIVPGAEILCGTLLHQLMPLFGLFRGAMNVKFRFNDSMLPSGNCELSYISGQPPGDLRQLDFFFRGANSAGRIGGHSIPMHVMKTDKTAEMQMPITNSSATAYINQYVDQELTSASYLYDQTWVTAFEYANAGFTKMEGFVAISDEAHFGAFLGLYALKVLPTAWPDAWSATKQSSTRRMPRAFSINHNNTRGLSRRE